MQFSLALSVFQKLYFGGNPYPAGYNIDVVDTLPMDVDAVDSLLAQEIYRVYYLHLCKDY